MWLDDIEWNEILFRYFQALPFKLYARWIFSLPSLSITKTWSLGTIICKVLERKSYKHEKETTICQDVEQKCCLYEEEVKEGSRQSPELLRPKLDNMNSIFRSSCSICMKCSVWRTLPQRNPEDETNNVGVWILKCYLSSVSAGLSPCSFFIGRVRHGQGCRWCTMRRRCK